MTDPHHTTPPSRIWRSAAGFAAAALAGTVLAPGLATGPAAADERCEEASAYYAVADADLLRLHAVDLPGVHLRPFLDVRLATTGAGLVSDAEGGSGDGSDDDPASVAAARDIAANILGPSLGGSSPRGLGRTIHQQALPSNGDPAKSSAGLVINTPLFRATVGELSAHAQWDEAMRCGAMTGHGATAAASLLDVEVLRGPATGASLVKLPDMISTTSQANLIEHDGTTAAQAAASASLADVRLFAGTPGEISIKVISEPKLEVIATGDAETSSVSYESPVVEISGPGIGTLDLTAEGTVDLMLTEGVDTGLRQLAGDPLSEIVDGLDLDGVTASAETVDSAIDPGTSSAPQGSEGETASLPLGEVVSDVSSLLGLNEVSIVRLSLGELDQKISDDGVRATAASVRLQVLTWPGRHPGYEDPAKGVLDLGLGILSAEAEAPAPTADDGPGDEAGEGGEETLPVTGSSSLGLVVGVGVLLAVAGRLMMLVTRNRVGTRLLG